MSLSFEGDANAPLRDEESVAIWQNVGIPKSRIYYKGVDLQIGGQQ